MPKKTSRRGFGWSRMRPGVGQKRKRESENGDERGGEDDADCRVVIGQENEERWARLRDRLGFGGDMDFASFLLDLAESERQTRDQSSTTEHTEEENNPPKDTDTSEEEPPEKVGTEESKDDMEEKEDTEFSQEEEEQPMSLMMVCEDQ